MRQKGLGAPPALLPSSDLESWVSCFHPWPAGQGLGGAAWSTSLALFPKGVQLAVQHWTPQLSWGDPRQMEGPLPATSPPLT